MLQRKQTLFLLLAVVLGMIHFQAWALFFIQMFASALCLYTIFRYKRRLLQARLCLVGILANLAWYIVLAVLIHQGHQSQTLPYTACLPLIAAILCFMARKAILSDEELVRSADRIR